MAGHYKELAHAYGNLATLLSSGVPIRRGMTTAAGTVRGPVARAFRQMGEQIGAGTGLAEAMRSHRGIFVRLDVRVAELGETSGNLAENIQALADYYTLREQVRRNIAGGMAFPILVLIMAALTAPLPALFLGGWDFDRYWLTVAGILGLFAVPAAIIWLILRFAPQTGPARAVLDGAAMLVPKLGSGVRFLAYSRYFHAFHLLLKAGAPMTRTVRFATEVCGNAIVRRKLAGGVAAVEEGSDVSAGFSRSLPAMYRDMFVVGEQSGQLDEVTLRLARLTGERAAEDFLSFSRWLPRFAYLLVALLIVYMIYENLKRIGAALPM